MKKAILAVSFGTSYHDTMEKTIAATERDLAAAFPDWTLRRAFTSGMILKKLKERDGITIDNVDEAMQRLIRDGFTQIAVQPTHIMHGEEYEKMLSLLAPYKKQAQIAVGMPLLHAQEDYDAVADAIFTYLPQPCDREALVFMGHGTSHFANAAYAQMEHVLQEKNERVYMATVEGYPALESVIRKLRKQPGLKKVTLAPFMLVAGDHATNDMAGSEDSWKSALEAEGYEVSCTMKGLGECEQIRARFVAHCRDAIAQMPARGCLWGIGVGPGDPELLTVKAVRLLQQADLVMVPESAGAEKTALAIAKPYLAGKEIVYISTPMTKDKAVMDEAHQKAAERICAYLDEGKQIAYLTLGDPTVYSTYFYIHQKVLAMGYPAQVVPGVTSFCAAAARLGQPLCLGSEPLLIIPASHEAEKLMDVPANKVFMKAGKSIMTLQQQLAAHGLLEGASMVENCTMEHERVYEDFSALKEPSGYFSLVIAKGGKQ